MTKNISTENTLCVIPWMHLNFEPDGKVIPCCLTSYHQYYAGDLTKETIEEVWNSKNMKDLRVEFLNNKKPKICATCFNRENITNESNRTFTNIEFNHVVKIIPEITEPDGTCKTMDLKYWDFRFSNLCNFKCRSCGPRYSSAWVPDAKKLGWVNEQDKVWNIAGVNNSTNFNFLKEQVDIVEKIYFAGGEPLMMPEHWQILDMLVEHKRFDVLMTYNTNASMLTYGGKNAIDYWRQWDPDKIQVWPSIDEIGERAELIRSGTVWPKVEENLKLLTTLDIIIRPGITVGAWNVRRLPAIINHLVELGVINAKGNYQNLFFSILQNPACYHVHIMPDTYRQETIIELKEFITHFNKKYNTIIDHVFTHILHELTKPWDAKAAKDFIWNTTNLDKVRNENIYEIIPEMNLVKESVSKHNYDSEN
jgi:radical SAM protein with 4Fe4S-binding SPASM domain